MLVLLPWTRLNRNVAKTATSEVPKPSYYETVLLPLKVHVSPNPDRKALRPAQSIVLRPRVNRSTLVILFGKHFLVYLLHGIPVHAEA